VRGLVLDAGALIAVDRDDRSMLALIGRSPEDRATREDQSDGARSSVA
jgi:hypothetical protein